MQYYVHPHPTQYFTESPICQELLNEPKSFDYRGEDSYGSSYLCAYFIKDPITIVAYRCMGSAKDHMIQIDISTPNFTANFPQNLQLPDTDDFSWPNFATSYTGKFFIMGGTMSAKTLIFDKEWTKGTDFHVIMSGACAVFMPLDDDNVYIFGGQNFVDFTLYSDVYQYSISEEKYSHITNIPLAYGIKELACTSYSDMNGEAFAVIGGGCQSTYDCTFVSAIKNVWKYSVLKDQWIPLADLPYPNAKMRFVFTNGYIYMFGGSDWTDECDHIFIRNVYKLNPEDKQQKWKNIGVLSEHWFYMRYLIVHPVTHTLSL